MLNPSNDDVVQVFATALFNQCAHVSLTRVHVDDWHLIIRQSSEVAALGGSYAAMYSGPARSPSAGRAKSPTKPPTSGAGGLNKGAPSSTTARPGGGFDDDDADAEEPGSMSTPSRSGNQSPSKGKAAVSSTAKQFAKPTAAGASSESEDLDADRREERKQRMIQAQQRAIAKQSGRPIGESGGAL